ncbi:hypothetical protein GF337_06305 [candidate division KSB1 bacterium]|nr:hypothetical protein [candidate division KSB1 bacterium]
MTLKFIERMLPPILRFFAHFKQKDKVISILDVLEQATKILIIMPTKLDDFGTALNYLPIVRDNFPKAKIDVLTLDIYRNLLHDNSFYGMIFVESKSINIFGLPKRELVQRISTSDYDIAIDMNDHFSLIGTHICQKSGAKLRICLEESRRDPFCNVSFRSPERENLDTKYRKLFKYLTANVGKSVAKFNS